MSEGVRIRPATPEDADRVARVFIASFGTLTSLPKLHTGEETFDLVANTVLRGRRCWPRRRAARSTGFIAMHGDLVELGNSLGDL